MAVVLPRPGLAEVTLLDAFGACEASVLEQRLDPLLEIGTPIERSPREQRIRLDTPSGTLVAAVSEPVPYGVM